MTSTKFWDKIANKYAAKPVADQATYTKKLEETRALLQPPMNVVEIGCGTGTTALLHAPHVAHIHATDVSPAMIEIAQSKARAQAVDNVTFEAIGIDDLDKPKMSVDMVMAHSLLHLLPNKNIVIAKVFRMLKPGGYFISSTACLADGMAWFKFIGPIGQALGVWPMVKVFGRHDLETSIVDAGFEIQTNWQPNKGKAVFIIAKRHT